MRDKKSQMEILGLAIVVVIMLIAAFFIVRFLVFKSSPEYRKGFLSSGLSSGFIGVFLKTDDNSCSQSMADLVRNCLEGGSLCCGNCESVDPGIVVDSCEFVDASARDMLSKTLDEWKYKYEFLIYNDINNPKIKVGEKCPSEKKSESYSIPSGYGIVYLRLDICG